MTNLADGSAAGVDVELSARLSEQLSLLAFGVVRDGTELVSDLTALVTTLSDSVSGYAGLRLTIVHSGHPVQLTALRPVEPEHPVVASLRLPLPSLSNVFEEGGRLVVWSTVPGALVDLAADLGYVLRQVVDGVDRTTPSVVELDVDLPMSEAGSGVDGLDELATIHRAAGLLIGRGHDPESVHETLRTRALEDGLSTSAWADRLLKAPGPGRRGESRS